MAERRTIGDILQELGRITQTDVERALAHQREHGGFFGEALIALGLVREEEIGWSLASQFDLPYVFPQAAAVDPEAAALVSPDWALEHVALPVARTGSRVVLLVDSPLNTAAPDELRERTGLEVELALASAGAIREVIRQVFRERKSRRAGFARRAPIPLAELADLAVASGSPRWGISEREDRVFGWYDQGGAVRRFPLAAGWARELETLLSPGLAERPRALGESAWTARLTAGSAALPLEVRSLASPEGREILFLPGDAEAASAMPPVLPGDLLDELRMLVERGTTSVAVRGDPPSFAAKVLPHLPGLVLPPGHRSIHLTRGAAEGHVPGVFTFPLHEDERGLAELDRLAEFRFDAVTIEADATPEVRERAFRIAPLVFALKGSGREVETTEGLDWLLELTEDREGVEPGWSLRPVSS